jgi:hypothetical protein
VDAVIFFSYTTIKAIFPADIGQFDQAPDIYLFSGMSLFDFTGSGKDLFYFMDPVSRKQADNLVPVQVGIT